MASCKILLITAIFAVTLQTGFSLKCYTCNEGTQPNCGDPFNKESIATAECLTDQVCAKANVANIDLKSTIFSNDPSKTVENLANSVKVAIARGCNAKNLCDANVNKDAICTVCTGELCNSSSFVLPSLGFICLLFVVKEFLNKWALN